MIRINKIPTLRVLLAVIALVVCADVAAGTTKEVSRRLPAVWTKDSFIEMEHSDKNHGDHNDMVLEEKDNKDSRALIEFPLDSLTGGWSVLSAEITFEIKNLDVDNGFMAISLHRVLEPWDEGGGDDDEDVTWSERKTSVSWSSWGGTFDWDPVATINLEHGDDEATFDITSLAQFWAENPDSNFGMLIADVTELYDDHDEDKAEFYSTDEGDDDRHPLVTMMLTDASTDSLIAEIQPYEVSPGSRPVMVLCVDRVIGTWGMWHTRYQVTLPSGFSNPSISSVTLDGAPMFFDNYSNFSTIYLDIHTPDTDGHLAVTFYVDAPGGADPVGKDFVPYLDNWGDGFGPVAAEEGDGDGTPGNGDTYRVYTVDSGVLDSIVVIPALASLSTDSLLTFSAVGHCDTGLVDPLTPTWSVEGGIGLIDEFGVFDPTTVGSGIVIAIENDLADTSFVTVTAGVVDSLAVFPADTTITTDDSLGFAASAFDADGNPLHPTITWREMEGLGSIDGVGLFVPDVIGTTTVIGTAGTVSDTASLIIDAGAVQLIILSPAIPTVTTDSILQFTAIGFDAKGNLVPLSPTWDVLGGIGAVDGAGLFDPTTVGNGGVVVTEGELGDTASVTVTHGAVDSLAVIPADTSITADDVVNFSASAWDADRNEFTPTTIWSEPTALGAIDGSGEFMPTLTGAAEVVATSGAFADTADVTIVSGELADIVISPSSAGVTTDSSIAFSASGFDAKGNGVVVIPVWSVDGGIGVIDGGGNFDPTVVGSGSVIAAVGSVRDTADLSVTNGIVDSLAVIPADTSITADDVVAFIASAWDADRNEFIPTTIWSEPTSLGAIDGSGEFTPTLTGAAEVVATSGALADTADVTIVSGELADIVVSPSSAAVTTDSSIAFSASGYDAKGNSIVISPVWGVTGGIGSIDGSGNFDPTMVGSGTVVASVGGVNDNSPVTVSIGKLDSLAVVPASATITVGESLAYSAEGYDADRNPFIPATVVWAEPEGLGSIDGDGLFIPASVGTGTIIGQAGGLSDTASFNAVAGALDSLVVVPSDTTLTADEQLVYTAIGYFAGGAFGPVSPTWSAPGDVGSITSGGLFGAVTVGSGTIIGRIGSVGDTVVVVVTRGAVDSIAVTPADTTISVEQTIQYSGAAWDADRNSFSVAIAWSEPEGIGSINGSGKFTPAVTGSGIVVGSAEGVSDTAAFTVTSGSLVSIEIAPALVSLTTDSLLAFTAIGRDAGGFEIDIVPVWSVSGGIGDVDPDGRFDPTTVGSGWVMAEADGFGDSASVAVTHGVADSLAILPADTIIEVDASVSFTYILYDADRNSFTAPINWTEPTGLGSINHVGVFTPDGTGTARIVGEAGGVRDTAEVVIIAGAVASLEVSPNSPTVNTEGTILFTALARDSEGNPIPDLSGVVWSGASSIGSIDPSSGLFEPTTVGVDSVTASYGAVDGASGPITVTVGPTRSITISPVAIILSFGGDTTFTVVIADGEGNATVDPVSWQVSGAIGAIDGNGHFYSNSSGSGLVIATAGGVSDTALVTILASGNLVLISVIEARDVVRRGETGILVDLIVRNNGSGAVSGLSSGLTFKNGAVDLTMEYSITPVQLTSLSLDPGETDTISYTVTVSDSATVGVDVSIDGTVSGIEAGSGDLVGDLNAGSKGSWTVQAAPLLEDVVRSLFPLAACPGKDATFAIALRNRGEAGLTFDTGTRFSFSDGDQVYSAPLLNVVDLPADGRSVYLAFDSDSIPAGFEAGSWAITIEIDGTDEFGLPYDNDFTAKFNAVEIYPPYVRVTPRSIVGSIVHPGADSIPLLHAELINLYEDARILTTINLDNRTIGEGSVSQRDSVWSALYLILDANGDGLWSAGETILDTACFESGTVSFGDFSLSIAEAETTAVLILGDLSPTMAPDMEELDGAIESETDIWFDESTTVYGEFPFDSPGKHFVDGMVAAQIALSSDFTHAIPAGADDSLALVMDIPSNGYLRDTLQTLMLENRGTSIAGSDISEIKLWADGGNGSFDRGSGDDTDLGVLPWIGDVWSASRLGLPVLPGGVRLFVTVDLPEDATEERSILLALPVDAIGVSSGNDGPIDSGLSSATIWITQGANRIVIGALSHGVDDTAFPGDTNSTVLRFLATNVYPDTAWMTGLTVTNLSSGEEPDSVATQVRLISLSRETGESPTDERILLSIAPTSGGVSSLSGFSLPIPPGVSCTLSVAADIALRCVADGDTVNLSVENENAFTFRGGTRRVVGGIPLTHESGIPIDGMAAAQIGLPEIDGGAVGPSESGRLVFSGVIPPNGCSRDTLTGIRFETSGSLLTSGIDRMQLYRRNAAETVVGDLVWDGSVWVREGISIPIEAPGETLLVRVDINSAATDGATFHLLIPEYGVTVASKNDGPVDRPAESSSMFQISTSPIFASISANPCRVSVGQEFDVNMIVNNHGFIDPMTIEDVFPDSLAGSGDSVAVLSTPESIPIAIEPGSEATYTWRYLAVESGTTRFHGNAIGARPGGGEVRTLLAESGLLEIQEAPTSIHVEASATLPPSVTVGTHDLHALVISLTHSDSSGSGAASIQVDSLSIFFEDDAGSPVDPFHLVEKIELCRTGLPIGEIAPVSTINGKATIPLTIPMLLTPGSGAAINVYFDFLDEAAVNRFHFRLTGEGVAAAVDANSKTAVSVTGDFPFESGNTDLYQPPSPIAVNLANAFPGTVNREALGASMASISFQTSGTAETTADIKLSNLSLFVGDGLFPFDSIRIISGNLNRFSGSAWSKTGDQIRFPLDPEIILPPDNLITLSIEGDVDSAAPLGTIRIDSLSIEPYTGSGEGEIPVVMQIASVPTTRIVERTDSIDVKGIDTAGPMSLFQGAAGIDAFGLVLDHSGGDSFSAIRLHALRIRLETDGEEAVEVRSIIDRIRLECSDVILSSIAPSEDDVDTVCLRLDTPLLVEPGDSLLLSVEIDLKADAATGEFRIVIEREYVDVRDGNDGLSTGINLGTRNSPNYKTLLFQILEMSDRLTYGVDLNLPALSVGGGTAIEALRFSLAVPGGEGGTDLHIAYLSLLVEDQQGNEVDPTRWISGGEAFDGDNIAVAGAAVETNRVRFSFDPPLAVAPGETLEVTANLALRTDTDLSPFRIGLDADDIGIVEAIPFIDRMEGDNGNDPSKYTYFADKDFRASIRNYPNPFSSAMEITTFAFYARAAGRATIRVYTGLGVPVVTLHGSVSGEGVAEIVWDGKNGVGKRVINGGYLAVIEMKYDDGTTEQATYKLAVLN